MIDLSLSPAGYRALLRTLATPGHMVSVEATILDLNHKPMGRLPRILSGQVNIDVNAGVKRQLQLEVLDSSRSLGVDASDGRPRLDRMIRVHYLVWVDAPINDWVAIPVFTGPITQVDRDGPTINIEASGKEKLAQGPTWKPRTFSKGRNRVNVIRVIMDELAGETRFQFPTGWTARTNKPISMGKASSAWTYAQFVAKSMNAQLFYDGRGRLRLRKKPIRSMFTFRDGDGGLLLTKPKVTEGSDELINAVRVTGAVPKGKKTALEHVSFLPESHMYSPHSLKRGPKVKYYPEEITDDTLRSKKEVKSKADRRIKEILVSEQLVSFDCLPMPLLEEWDPFVIDSDGVNVMGRVSQMSLPLTHDSPSTVGYLASLKKRKTISRMGR